jgi:hypothetical protein
VPRPMVCMRYLAGNIFRRLCPYQVNFTQPYLLALNAGFRGVMGFDEPLQPLEGTTELDQAPNPDPESVPGLNRTRQCRYFALAASLSPEICPTPPAPNLPVNGWRPSSQCFAQGYEYSRTDPACFKRITVWYGLVSYGRHDDHSVHVSSVGEDERSKRQTEFGNGSNTSLFHAPTTFCVVL